jgi:hypothetical protein
MDYEVASKQPLELYMACGNGLNINEVGGEWYPDGEQAQGLSDWMTKNRNL